MAIKVIEEKELWDDFVEKSPYGLLFHKWDFLKIIEKHSGYKLLPYGIYNAENLICIFPLFFKKYLGLKMLFSPPPKTVIPNLGFALSQEYDNLKQSKKESWLNIIADEIDEEIKKLSPNYILFSTYPNFLDIRAFKWNGYNIETGYTYTINLNDSLENLWMRVKQDVRREIKKAEGKIKLIRDKNPQIFFEMMVNRYKEQGLNFPIISIFYLKEVMKKFENNISLYYVYNEDNIVGAHISLFYKNRYISWLGGAKAMKNVRANEYCEWEFMKLAKSEGYEIYELEGASVKNLCQFKSKFNPSLEICFTIFKKDLTGKIAENLYLNFIKKKMVF